MNNENPISDNTSFHKTNFHSIDPRLQFYASTYQTNPESLNFISADEGAVPVIAKISDLNAWQALSEVQPGIEIKDGEQWIVTATIPISRIEFVHEQPYVITLKPTQPIFPNLKATIEDLGLNKPSTAVPYPEGESVIVGIVDYGCDFKHESFKNSNGTSRILSIWDQKARANPNSPYGYGKVYQKIEIDGALKNSDSYKTLGYHPGGSRGHGTHVMDIAAGCGKHPGVAPKADIIFVDISTREPKTKEDIVSHDFGDSVRVIEAVKYIFDQAQDKPCVVNLSLGTNGGPHDGSNPVELALDALLREKPNRAIVIAAANAYTDKIHKTGQVKQDETVSFKWRTSTFDKSHNEMEIWYDGDDEFEFELLDAKGRQIAKVDLEENGYVESNSSSRYRKEMLFYVSHRKKDPNNGDNVVHIFHNPIKNGEWTIKLRGKKVVSKGIYHAWIERDDAIPKFKAYPSVFVQDEPSHTLGSISCGQLPIVVASYDAHKGALPISYFSSAGPTRDGRTKPELCAPGHAVWAANSSSNDGLVRMSGTSMAAPAVTGVIARLFSLALSQGKVMPIETTRKILIDTARKTLENTNNEWHNRYGFGRINAIAALQHAFFQVKCK